MLEHGGTGETYNIGARREWTNLDVVERICDLLDEIPPGTAERRGLISFVADRPGHGLRCAMVPARSNASSAGAHARASKAGLRRTSAGSATTGRGGRISSIVATSARIGLGQRKTPWLYGAPRTDFIPVRLSG